MIKLAVSDSTALITLARIERLALLPRLIGRILIPDAVRAETGTDVDWLSVRAIRNSALIAALRTQVGPGEAEALALAAETPGAVLILDDKKARRLAAAMTLPVVGTVGLVVRAKREGVVPACRPLLDELRAADFHMSPALYRDALRLAGETEP